MFNSTGRSLLARDGAAHCLRLGVWDKVLPAAAFDAFDVRPSLKVREAALAARGEVCFAGAFR